jgi:hypothetical protein
MSSLTKKTLSKTLSLKTMTALRSQEDDPVSSCTASNISQVQHLHATNQQHDTGDSCCFIRGKCDEDWALAHFVMMLWPASKLCGWSWIEARAVPPLLHIYRVISSLYATDTNLPQHAPHLPLHTRDPATSQSWIPSCHS